jgi:hypothetical protein
MEKNYKKDRETKRTKTKSNQSFESTNNNQGTQTRAHTRREKLQPGIVPPTHHTNIINPAHTPLLILTQEMFHPPPIVYTRMS